MEPLVARLQILVETNVRALIDDHHDLAVTSVEGQENVIFEIRCQKEDVGLIIGRKGKNIEAIRTLIKSACRGVNLNTTVEVVNAKEGRA
jgi:uncharacterized protein